MVFVRQIVDEHRGNINLDSEVGKGTTVTISLPILFNEAPLKKDGSVAGPVSICSALKVFGGQRYLYRYGTCSKTCANQYVAGTEPAPLTFSFLRVGQRP